MGGNVGQEGEEEDKDMGLFSLYCASLMFGSLWTPLLLLLLLSTGRPKKKNRD